MKTYPEKNDAGEKHAFEISNIFLSSKGIARFIGRCPGVKITAFSRFMERVGQMRPITWFIVHVGTRIDPVLMRLSGGRVNVTGTDAVVILHHVGAKTGKERQTPLLYFTEGRDVILIASKGGAARHPAWLHNLRANPDVELWVGKRGGPYRARVANAEEKALLWPKANALYAGYDGYQELAGDRDIPVVICSPRS